MALLATKADESPATALLCSVGLLAYTWSFYIFSSGGTADKLLIGDFDFELVDQLGVLRHFLA